MFEQRNARMAETQKENFSSNGNGNGNGHAVQDDHDEYQYLNLIDNIIKKG